MILTIYLILFGFCVFITLLSYIHQNIGYRSLAGILFILLGVLGFMGIDIETSQTHSFNTTCEIIEGEYNNTIEECYNIGNIKKNYETFDQVGNNTINLIVALLGVLILYSAYDIRNKEYED